MKSGLNYLDYAENDYLFFMDSIKSGEIYNMQAMIAEQICEKYLKHIIAEYILSNITDEKELSYGKHLLHSHNITEILNYIDEFNEEIFNEEEYLRIAVVESYYINSRYPSDNSFFIKEKDIEKCKKAVILCRDKTLEFIENHTKTKEFSR